MKRTHVGYAVGCTHEGRWASCAPCRDEHQHMLEAKLADREARLKAVRPICGQIHFCEGDTACVWCRAFRATDLRVRDWKGKP